MNARKGRRATSLRAVAATERVHVVVLHVRGKGGKLRLRRQHASVSEASRPLGRKRACISNTTRASKPAATQEATHGVQPSAQGSASQSGWVVVVMALGRVGVFALATAAA